MTTLTEKQNQLQSILLGGLLQVALYELYDAVDFHNLTFGISEPSVRLDYKDYTIAISLISNAYTVTIVALDNSFIESEAIVDENLDIYKEHELVRLSACEITDAITNIVIDFGIDDDFES